jgi:hypothetical protein
MTDSTTLAERPQTNAVLTRLPFGAPAEEVARLIERDGAVILTAALTPDQVDAVNREFDAVGLKVQRDFKSEEWGGKTRRLLHCLKYSPTLREAFLDTDTLSSYLAATLPGPKGAYAMFASHAIEIHPGETAQALHRDAANLMEIVGTSGPTGTNFMINFLMALTEVTEEMGATRVIPGSQHWAGFETPGTQEQTIAATLQPGDVLAFSGKVLHGGGANVTTDQVRRVVTTPFTPGFMMGEEAWPHVISADEVRTYPKRLQGYLGFRSISWKGEEPGFLWRADGVPLEERLGL